MVIVKNTFPSRPGIAHGVPGDEVYWDLSGGFFWLIRCSDKKAVFCSAKVNRNGILVSNGKRPVLIGVIVENKKRGYVFEVRGDNQAEL